MTSERDHEAGSVLMLMPAAVLVLLALAAVAVDGALVFMAQREVASATAAAANDAAVAALGEASFYDCGELVLDEARAAEVATAAFAARGAGFLTPAGPPQTTVEAAPDGRLVQVRVRAQAEVELIFLRALPGGLASRTVSASSVAVAEHDGLLDGVDPIC